MVSVETPSEYSVSASNLFMIHVSDKLPTVIHSVLHWDLFYRRAKLHILLPFKILNY